MWFGGRLDGVQSWGGGLGSHFLLVNIHAGPIYLTYEMHSELPELKRLLRHALQTSLRH